MKKIFLALTIALTMIGSMTEAADITDEQFKKIIQDVGQTKIESHFHMSAYELRTQFNWYIVPIIQDDLHREDISDLLPLFKLDNYEVLDSENGKIYLGRFKYKSVALVCLSDAEDADHSKIFSLYYTSPEKKEYAVFISWFLTAFVGSISTEIDVKTLMGELTAENSSGSVVKDGFKFSLAEDGNLNVLSVTLAQ